MTFIPVFISNNIGPIYNWNLSDINTRSRTNNIIKRSGSDINSRSSSGNSSRYSSSSSSNSSRYVEQNTTSR